MKVWLVQGVTGEYDDMREWIVCGFLDKNKAEELVQKATEWADNLKKEHAITRKPYYMRGDEKNPHDPYFRMDYNGTEYRLFDIEVVE